MPQQYVNLDALVPREDFEVDSEEPMMEQSKLGQTMRITDLGIDGLIYHVLRKPDFQRETANWTPQKVADLVRSFLDGDLIPALILWRSPKSGNIFIIDGAHRLSALTAWVHDDYGDSHTSMRFFENNIPPDQKRAAEATRNLISQSVGSYSDLLLALRNPDTAVKDRLRLARNLSILAMDLQWVSGGAEKAENSFFRINQQATPIDQTELDLIKARRKPNALAARAFIRAGTGHKYWSDFDEDTKNTIEQLGKEVYDLIFKPNVETSIKTADLPVAGRGYSSDSLKMVFELVNFVNKLTPDMWRESDSKTTKSRVTAPGPSHLTDDADGSETIRFMRAVRRVAGRISGNGPGSLGLHPAVYFYGATGKFQPAAFLAAVEFVLDLEKTQSIAKFTTVRAEFEEFLIKYRHFFNQIVRNYGSFSRAAPHVVKMLRTAFEALKDDCSEQAILERLKGEPTLKSLREITADDRLHGRNFSQETKNLLMLNELLERETRCAICGARLPRNSVSFDHRLRKQDGGNGSPENGQLTHPYCNTGYKESAHSKEISQLA
ncbi:HNH endonuclease family protein [Micromonospora sp. NPDC047762]|uniref:HNH endonuclease family protein n=1 Tax=Micromonospora sp. NPDC047762 TaxID=3364255 RepID=UPI0037134067